MVISMLMAAAVGEGVWAAVGGYGTVTTADILAPPVLILTYVNTYFVFVTQLYIHNKYSKKRPAHWVMIDLYVGGHFSTNRKPNYRLQDAHTAGLITVNMFVTNKHT